MTREELERLLEKATPGPWKDRPSVHGNQYRYVQIGKDRDYTTLEMQPDDARLAALAPTLAREVISAREEIERLRDAPPIDGLVHRLRADHFTFEEEDAIFDEAAATIMRVERQRADAVHRHEQAFATRLLFQDRAEAAEAKLKEIGAVVDEQANESGLWFIPIYATEALLQQELRRLHAMIEGKTPDECAIATLTEPTKEIKP